MALRSIIARLVLAGRNALALRRRFLNLGGPKNNKVDNNSNTLGPSSDGPDEVCTYNADRARVHSELYRILDARMDNKETIQCENFTDDDAINASKFADECVSTSYKFAEEDTINAVKLVDEHAINCAKFAVDEIARAKEVNIEFVRVLRSSRNPSWSHDYQIILEAVDNDSGEKGLYYAQVQMQLWTDEKPFKLIMWKSE